MKISTRKADINSALIFDMLFFSYAGKEACTRLPGCLSLYKSFSQVMQFFREPASREIINSLAHSSQVVKSVFEHIQGSLSPRPAASCYAHRCPDALNNFFGIVFSDCRYQFQQEEVLNGERKKEIPPSHSTSVSCFSGHQELCSLNLVRM